MMKTAAGFLAGLVCLGFVGDARTQDTIQIHKVEGIVHVLNPGMPLKGTLRLEIEKTLTINPYNQPDVGFGWFSFLRREDGAVILYEGTEFHRFGPRGEYLGPLAKEGQGPGEFPKMASITPFFLAGKIWLAGAMKLSEFDPDGKFLGERKLAKQPSLLVDGSHFLAERTERGKDGLAAAKTLILVRFGKESLLDVQEAEYLGGAGLGIIRNKTGKGGLVDPWGTPNLCFAYDPQARRIYTAINTEYKIWVKSLRGDTLSIIEKANSRAKVDRKDIVTMMPFAKTEQGKWMLDAYPDRYVAMNSMQPLPNGYLLVRRVTGPKQTVIDVFGPDGKYLYLLLPPEGMDFNAAVFHARGFSRTAAEGDFRVYEDYRVLNLSEVFGK
jgi:hypothetical protein